MRIKKISVGGVGRFADTASVVMNGKLLALLGPNEAGKSTFLRALNAFTSGSIPTRLATRSTSLIPTVTVVYELQESDFEGLDDVHDVRAVRAIEVTVAEQSRIKFYPRSPQRDVSQRRELEEWLNARRAYRLVSNATQSPESESMGSLVESAKVALASTADTLPDAGFAALQALLGDLDQYDLRVEDPGLEDATFDDLTSAASARRFSAVVAELIQRLRRLIDRELAPSPATVLREALRQKRPRFILFSQEDRDLRPTYAVEDLSEEIPQALRNLASMAGLDVQRYLTAVEQQDDTLRQRLQRGANQQLETVFSTRWSQARVELQIELATDRIVLYVVPKGDTDFARFDERSDGLRQFVALLAFIHSATGDQLVLLIDEVETHLHYDAQSDLIDILLEQQITSGVIYTTHSVGALPHDIAGCCRAVNTVADQRSEIVSNLWSGEAGWRPVFTAMGAAGMSLTPSRYSLVCEGQSDSMLLPSLFREVSGMEQRFHVAPGLASLSQAGSESLSLAAARVACLVDGDEPGVALADRLVEVFEMDRDKVLSIGRFLGEGCVLEDLVDDSVYRTAVLDEIRFWSDLPDVDFGAFPDSFQAPNRPGRVEVWCKEAGARVPDKAAVAGRILLAMDERHGAPELIGEVGAVRMVAPEAVEPIRELLAAIQRALGITPHAAA